MVPGQEPRNYIRRRAEWSKEARCKGKTDMFFPNTGRPKLRPDYYNICHSCPVIFECLSWAIAHDAWGIWGNTTRDERDELRKTYFYGIKERAIREGWYEGSGFDDLLREFDLRITVTITFDYKFTPSVEIPPIDLDSLNLVSIGV